MKNEEEFVSEYKYFKQVCSGRGLKDENSILRLFEIYVKYVEYVDSLYQTFEKGLCQKVDRAFEKVENVNKSQ